MELPVAFAPELGLDSPGFVDAWNGAPECRALAEARLSPQAPQGFPLDPQLVEQGLVVLSGLAAGAGALALDALKDALKEKLTEILKDKLSRKPSIQVEAVRQPGGAYLLVVTGEDP